MRPRNSAVSPDYTNTARWEAMTSEERLEWQNSEYWGDDFYDYGIEEEE
jgi:hypothetical protein